jgi:hypothetical protein
MSIMDELEKCTAFSKIRGVKLRLADGVRHFSVSRMLWIHEKSHLLRSNEVSEIKVVFLSATD